jgi:hypothetical protein
VETVTHLRELGHRVVLVSSGAIGVGLRRMGLKERGKGLSHKQVSLIKSSHKIETIADTSRNIGSSSYWTRQTYSTIR